MRFDRTQSSQKNPEKQILFVFKFKTIFLDFSETSSLKPTNTEPNYISFFGKEKTALLFEKEKKELLELLTKLNYPTEEIKILIEFTFQNQTKK